jgi:hypothetical protein
MAQAAAAQWPQVKVSSPGACPGPDVFSHFISACGGKLCEAYEALTVWRADVGIHIRAHFYAFSLRKITAS